MSGLPIMPATPAAPAFQREAIPQAQPAPGQGIAATVRTQTGAAVQQAPAAQTAHALAPKALPTTPDRRARLVGPPPTFEINILQDMRETRDAPATPEMQDREKQETCMHTTGAPRDAGSEPAPEVAQTPSDYAGYAALRCLAGVEDMADTSMDRSV